MSKQFIVNVSALLMYFKCFSSISYVVIYKLSKNCNFKAHFISQDCFLFSIIYR